MKKNKNNINSVNDCLGHMQDLIQVYKNLGTFSKSVFVSFEVKELKIIALSFFSIKFAP